MSNYGQFCPVAKATELVGEKWTLLLLRELLLGTTRFNDFQRALSRMSPTLLVKRLRHLEESGILIRKKLTRQRGYEYLLTAAGKELAPLVETLAIWGMRWARSQLRDDELDVEFLMRELQRRMQTQHLPDGQTVICVTFEELSLHKTWWLLVEGDVVDLCTEDPGKDVDLYVNSNVRTLVQVWHGDLDIRMATKNEEIRVCGMQHLIRTMPEWFGISIYKDVERGDSRLLLRQAE